MWLFEICFTRNKTLGHQIVLVAFCLVPFFVEPGKLVEGVWRYLLTPE